jgi:acetyl-CoA carboxylase carboxyl transferase subunit alpha
MSQLQTPIVCTVIGEGGSGGALAIGVGDRVMMLEYSTYSVISPEGCASILWKSAEKAADAAEAMGITAAKLKDAGLIDQIIREPLGSAHRDVDETARNIKQALIDSLEKFETMGLEAILEQRYKRLTSYGDFLEETPG